MTQAEIRITNLRCTAGVNLFGSLACNAKISHSDPHAPIFQQHRPAYRSQRWDEAIDTGTPTQGNYTAENGMYRILCCQLLCKTGGKVNQKGFQQANQHCRKQHFPESGISRYNELSKTDAMRNLVNLRNVLKIFILVPQSLK